MSDLLSIGSSGVQAQQKLLYTTGNNISNVNTQGYVRQTTTLYTNTTGLGVGMSQTSRTLDIYSQREMWKDTSTLNYYQGAYNQLSATDQLLSDSSNSISTALTSYFNAFQTANSSPSTSAGRQGLLTQVGALSSQFNTLSNSLSSQYTSINNNISGDVSSINTLLTGINQLNKQIQKAGTVDDGTTSNLLDQRDDMIKQLSEKMDIRTVPQSDGTTLVNLPTGESLVLADGAATLSVTQGNPDVSQTGLQIQVGNSTSTLNTSSIGGELGGYYLARSQLEPVQRQLGQLSVAIADAMNTQNSLGMTLNNKVGGNIYTLPTSTGIANANNTGSGAATVSFMPGQGANVTSNDFEVRFTGSNSFEVYMLDGNSSSLVGSGSTPPSQYDMASYGISLNLSGTPASGDKILLQPTKNAASNMTVAISSTDDFALASPVLGTASSSNYGTGTISLAGVYNTDSTTSGFTSSGLQSTAPHSIKIDSSGNYEVYDGSSNLLGVAPASCNGQDIMANLLTSVPGGSAVYSDVKTSPGYDFNVSGTVKANDSFSIAFNTDGFSDNHNGLALADLQNQALVRNGSSTSTSKNTFSQAYTSTVSSLGSTVNSLNTNVSAATAKLSQSQALYDSTSGVSLDEEASNLLKFQQAYSASAQIITAAKTVFDSLLQAAR